MALTSCHVSEAWALQESTTYRFPVNPPQPRVARAPMTYPVPVSHRAPLASGGMDSMDSQRFVPLPAAQDYAAAYPAAAHSAHPAHSVASVASASAPATSHRSRGSVLSRAFLGKKVRFENGRAIAPAHAPEAVHRAVAAANHLHLQNVPYKWGGGHARLNDDGYDCSGAVSYVLREAGLMEGHLTSRGFRRYGSRGQGKWITLWVRDGHVFMTIGGLRFDTGGSAARTGPRWKPEVRSKKGLSARHPRGF